ncbi:MAG: 1,6-anhydro-N-acetylmuramyl-L-alanine amidase AmpD [Gammaproteobacteria bacterium]|nr:MAG: 1,6-anhydro-N-acetylmuramyl-L-alanine amidase AmpD [Gammaproteobacteria bacterium]
MKIINGILQEVTQIPSPNFDERPINETINLLVIHNISLPPGKFGDNYIVDFFCNKLKTDQHPFFASIKNTKVSSHFLILRNGEIIQFINTKRRAWHAGLSEFNNKKNCNDYSIGVELEGTDNINYTPQQYHALKKLTESIIKEYPKITKTRITGHSNIAKGRKTDPGDSFKWQLYFKSLGADF